MTQGTVISLKMMVTEMGDRGSKSDKACLLICKRATSRRFFNQVYRSVYFFFLIVRCTLVAGKPVLG